jgi:uncharacterized membrane protein YfcA
LFVDAARLPVYLVTQGEEIAGLWVQVLVLSGGVVVGTLLGRRILGRLSPPVFRQTIALLLIGLGAYMLWGGGPERGT